MMPLPFNFTFEYSFECSNNISSVAHKSNAFTISILSQFRFFPSHFLFACDWEEARRFHSQCSNRRAVLISIHGFRSISFAPVLFSHKLFVSIVSTHPLTFNFGYCLNESRLVECHSQNCKCVCVCVNSIKVDSFSDSNFECVFFADNLGKQIYNEYGWKGDFLCIRWTHFNSFGCIGTKLLDSTHPTRNRFFGGWQASIYHSSRQ